MYLEIVFDSSKHESTVEVDSFSSGSTLASDGLCLLIFDLSPQSTTLEVDSIWTGVVVTCLVMKGREGFWDGVCFDCFFLLFGTGACFVRFFFLPARTCVPSFTAYRPEHVFHLLPPYLFFVCFYFWHHMVVYTSPCVYGFVLLWIFSCSSKNVCRKHHQLLVPKHVPSVISLCWIRHYCLLHFRINWTPQHWNYPYNSSIVFWI